MNPHQLDSGFFVVAPPSVLKQGRLKTTTLATTTLATTTTMTTRSVFLNVAVDAKNDSSIATTLILRREMKGRKNLVELRKISNKSF